VSSYISSKIDIEDSGEKNDTLLMDWMIKINATIESILPFIEHLSEDDNYFKELNVKYSKIVSINISIMVNLILR
jgi:hypothetical protein